jgi:hypothetical protein
MNSTRGERFPLFCIHGLMIPNVHISMDQLPRWRAMEHVPAATTIDFAEGETWLTILKVRS